jgi:G3E family GTPase
MNFLESNLASVVSGENIVSFSMPGGGRPDFDAFVIKSTRPISHARLEEFLNEVSPASSRIKGFVRLDKDKVVAVQSCFGNTELLPVEGYTGPTELIFVGQGIDRLSFEKKLNL